KEQRAKNKPAGIGGRRSGVGDRVSVSSRFCGSVVLWFCGSAVPCQSVVGGRGSVVSRPRPATGSQTAVNWGRGSEIVGKEKRLIVTSQCEKASSAAASRAMRAPYRRRARA